MSLLNRFPWMLLLLALAVAYPIYPPVNDFVFSKIGQPVGNQLPTLFIFAILALGLNVVIGYAGLLHLGIGAFFGVGAYLTGILTVADYPFQLSFPLAVLISILGAAALSVMLSAPVLRLRGDYLALVTLGFGEVLRFTLRNLEQITNGTKGIKPVPSPTLFDSLIKTIAGFLKFIPGAKELSEGGPLDWSGDYRYWYFLTLFFLVIVVILLRNLERSRLGRGWVAIREDELAAACMGLNTARLKLAAFAIGAGLAGLAGALYAYRQSNTADPDTYGFNNSVIVLCCLILGGLGNRKGVIIGVLLIIGYENIISPALDSGIQDWIRKHVDTKQDVRLAGINLGNEGAPYLTFSGWRLMIFGMVLILVMRFRPHGLFPARRDK
ncbi:branched-chain amino acid ABC transporter permease [Telmatocola sphagniphila]|uniref:Branched-chain amino acid ABC transporter permease n=1 Tax=Telmatocola sphagniphila TaxID=1123043 RepID=A0A8E6B5I3_9BACT|nr:branched-chain amino acid ABC transporter permease [Telmatocola sphagniphila]QVL32116.1 branched-chain amino acid ABC transporter permease [Telmatocola sphagniphila]